jgi:transcriptional regulator with XRE-family HTH domain
MEKICARLKKVRKSVNMSMREFSKEIAYSHSLYGLMEHGDREPTDRIIQLIAGRFSINKDWLLTGNGRMLASSLPDMRFQRIMDIYNIIDDSLKDCLLDQSKILLKLHRIRKKEG